MNPILALGETGISEADWLAYKSMGLTPEHIPELIRIATDKRLHRSKNEEEVWAPVHAWRALGQLQAVEAISPLLQLLDDTDLGDDWLIEEIPRVIEEIGLSSLPTLEAYLLDPSQKTLSRSVVGECLTRLAKKYPESRADCLKFIMAALEKYRENDRELNGFLVGDLVELNAVEAAPLIEQAFRDECVDFEMAGDWEEVQIALGLRTERVTPRPRFVNLAGFDTDFEETDVLEWEEDAEGVESSTYVRELPKVGRNEPCPCGSGKKFKKCCLEKG